MVSAMATLANDGVRVPPRLVLGTIDSGRTFHPSPAPQPERVVSSGTARTLASMLEGVVVRGTGKGARLPGYRLAGKTGTAQKIVDGRYSEDEFMASFGGFGPVSAPRLVALVVLDTPHVARHMGGQVAAPAVGRILEEALRYLRVPYDEELPPEAEPPARTARDSRPRGAAPFPPPAPAPVDPQALPELRGLSLREAVAALASHGWRPRAEGSGVVVEQDPPAGTPFDAARICRLRLGDREELEALVSQATPPRDRDGASR
jgi:membrane peptidoglycan carboxypeptidase